MPSRIDVLERQVREVEALESIWMDDFVMDEHERVQYGLVASILEAGDSSAAEDAPPISGRIELSAMGTWRIAARFSLPLDYPDNGAPRLQIECADASREVHDRLTLQVQKHMDEHIADMGMDGCLLTSLDCLRDAAEIELRRKEHDDGDITAEGKNSVQGPQPGRPIQIGRRLIWFHHIKSVTKRKHIVEWAGELKLGGFSKPGFPGIVVIEGLEEDAAEYVQRLKRLRWQAMAVRVEDTCEVDEPPSKLQGSSKDELPNHSVIADPIRHARKLPETFTELSESGLTELGQQCRSAGLEDLFLAAMKITR